MKLELLSEEEIVAEASKDSTYCQLSVDMGHWASRRQARVTTYQLLYWLIDRRKALQEKKSKAKPDDVQSQAVIGGKIKVFQQVIDKIMSLKLEGVTSDN